MIKLKGGSGFAVGVSIREVVESILLDSRKVLPVSTMQQGLYGLRDVCLSVPTVVGAQGVMAQIEIALAPREQVALHNSARVLRETLDAVKNRLASGGSPAAAAAPQAAAAPFSTGPRAIPRAAWQSR
jgi:L-lactate dehydrogenase